MKPPDEIDHLSHKKKQSKRQVPILWPIFLEKIQSGNLGLLDFGIRSSSNSKSWSLEECSESV